MIMIKKLLLASFFATILSITNYVSAHNFVPISTSGYDYLYLDTDTVNVVLYNPPSYIIDAEYISRNANISTDTITKVRFCYDLTTKTITYKTLCKCQYKNVQFWRCTMYSYSFCSIWFRNRYESPVMLITWAWWSNRSTIALATLSSCKMVAHSSKLMLEVTMVLFFSYRLSIIWNSKLASPGCNGK